MADHFGLDIGSNSIKIIQLEKNKIGFRLVAAGIAKNPLLNFNLDDEKGVISLAEAIKKLKNESRVTTNFVVTALPERSIFSQVIELPAMSEKELAQALPWEAENVIPHPISDVNLDWEIIKDEESVLNKKMKVLLVAAPKILVDQYLQVLKLAELQAVSLEIESLAAIRALKPLIQEKNVALVNIGAKSLDIILVNKGYPCLSRQLPSAGEAITRIVSSGLGLDISAAEEYKKTYGLSPQLEGKVAATIEPILSTVSNEMLKAFRYYEETYKTTLNLMIIYGGTSLMPEITEYFAKSLGVEVQIADPLSLLVGNQPDLQAFRVNSSLFTIACGLALKGKLN